MEALGGWTLLWAVLVGIFSIFFWLCYFADLFDGPLDDKPFGFVAGTWILGSLAGWFAPIFLTVWLAYMLIRGLYWLPKTANFWIKEYRNV